jgi:hypothetical protein
MSTGRCRENALTRGSRLSMSVTTFVGELKQAIVALIYGQCFRYD